MPSHDPLIPFFPRRPKGAPPHNPEPVSIAHLDESLRDAMRAAAAAIRERHRTRMELLKAQARRTGPARKRKPPEAGLPVPAVPPRGPLPLQGGAEAPLDFGD